ncbi:MAG: mechanosensitive ion channel [Nitrososphaerota archaeon]
MSMEPETLNLILRIVSAVMVLVIAYFLSKHARLSFEKSLSRFGTGFASKFAEIVRYFIIFMGAAIAISILSLDVMAISIIGAVIFILVLVSMRDIFLNMAAELYLAIRRPFKENDWIRVGDVEGVVKSIGGMDTELITYDGDLVIIPNSFFLRHPVINKSQSIVRRIEFKLMMPRMDLDRVKETVQEVMKEIKPELLGDPELISIKETGDKVEVIMSLPIVNLRKLRWLSAKIVKAYHARGIDVEIE